MAPGDYHLVYDLNAFAANDPLGDFDTKNFSLGLQVSAVPETGTTVVLLGLSLAGLFAFRRFLVGA